jgi:hypothetical protein
MKALSIKQPWAYAILNKGKDIENRKWKTKFRGNFLIHAAKTTALNAPLELHNEWLTAYERGEDSAMLGGVVGVVELVDCLESTNSKWHQQGLWGFVLREPVKLPFRPLKGMLSFFEVNP